MCKTDDLKQTNNMSAKDGDGRAAYEPVTKRHIKVFYSDILRAIGTFGFHLSIFPACDLGSGSSL